MAVAVAGDHRYRGAHAGQRLAKDIGVHGWSFAGRPPLHVSWTPGRAFAWSALLREQRSGVGQPPEQLDCPRQFLLLLLGELAADGLEQPALALATLGFQRETALVGQLQQRAAPVVGIGAATDQPLGLELAYGLRHRLWAHALGGGQVAGASRAFAVEAAEHRAVCE